MPPDARFGNWMGQSDNRPPQPLPQQTQPNNPPQNGGNPPISPTNTDPNTNNNTSTNTDPFATLWDQEANEPPSNGNGQGDPPPQNTNQPPQRTDEQIRAEIATHLGSVGLGDMQLSAQDVERFSGENNHQEFANHINTRIQQAYLQAVQSSQRLINAEMERRLPAMVEEAVNKSKSFFEGDRLRSILKADQSLGSLMSDPATGPIVETVMRQHLVKGHNKDKALELTRQYFQRVRQAMDPEYVPPNTNTRTTFRGNPGKAMNFVDVLKGN